MFVTIVEKIYELRKLEIQEKYSKEFDDVPVKEKENKKYVPAISHPWKLEAFKEQIRNPHEERKYA